MGTQSRIELDAVLRFVDVATDALAGAREEIDALNVYPVPDSDTGTNMFLTISAARDGIREAVAGESGRDVGPALAGLARGALLGARGNSGVILSEMLGAMSRRMAAATGEERNAAVLAAALHDASEASHAAVGVPVEGTMLSVCRAAAEAAVARALDATSRSRDVLYAAAAAAREALERTPDQLRVLREAGVVDAGGRGLTVLFDAAESAISGRPVRGRPRGTPGIPIPRTTPPEPAAAVTGPAGGPHALSADGPAYEVMYLLDADDGRVPALRERLTGLGDSLVVVGGDRLWNVHIHVDDVGAAIEAGIEAGRPHRVRVTHFADQVETGARPRRPTRLRAARVVLAVPAGPGLGRLFEEAGAAVVATVTGRPSTRELIAAVLGSGASEVVVLPNDGDTLRAARAAAHAAETDTGGAVRVAVIPTRSQVQGLAALAVHEPGRSFDQDVLEMTSTARHTRHGGVTVAVRRAMTMAGPCEAGDVLGVVEGDFGVVGADLVDVSTQVLVRLLGPGGELVTLVSGADDPDGSLAAGVAGWLEEQHPAVDVVTYAGGQARYPLLVSVE